jgi:hypothetical protein
MARFLDIFLRRLKNGPTLRRKKKGINRVGCIKEFWDRRQADNGNS